MNCQEALKTIQADAKDWVEDELSIEAWRHAGFGLGCPDPKNCPARKFVFDTLLEAIFDSPDLF